MSNLTCPVCDSEFSSDTTKRGRPQIYCADKCTQQAYRQRLSDRVQAERSTHRAPCIVCGGPVVHRRLGPVATTCSKFCREIASGSRRAVPLPSAYCALPDCGIEFAPIYNNQKCCSERHGKMLYNRVSRADGRQAPEPWGDGRKDRYHRRRALKKGASTGIPVLQSEITIRDLATCGLCGLPVDDSLAWPHPQSPSLDHVIPLSKGGIHDPSNVQLAHLRCNTAKGNRLTA